MGQKDGGDEGVDKLSCNHCCPSHCPPKPPCTTEWHGILEEMNESAYEAHRADPDGLGWFAGTKCFDCGDKLLMLGGRWLWLSSLPPGLLDDLHRRNAT